MTQLKNSVHTLISTQGRTVAVVNKLAQAHNRLQWNFRMQREAIRHVISSNMHAATIFNRFDHILSVIELQLTNYFSRVERGATP